MLLTWQPLERQEWLRAFRSSLAAGRELPPIPTTGPSPLSLGDPERIRDLLAGAGFTDVQITGHAEPMYYGVDADDAFRSVSAQQAGLVRDLPEVQRAGALDALRADLAAHETADGVLYDLATWLVRGVDARVAAFPHRLYG